MFNDKSTASEVIAGHDLAGVNAVVTGGAAGLGFATAHALAGAGARVLLAGRNQEQGRDAAGRLREQTGNDAIEFARLDLASLESIRSFCGSYTDRGRALHLLIANAGVMAVPLSYTEDGFETQFGVNHLGHFALTTGLLPALRAAGKARVVVLSSRAHRRSDVHFEDPDYRNRPYDPWEAYGQSKSANALFAVAVTQRYGAERVTANAVMPGAINTGLQDHLDAEALRRLGWVESNGSMVPPPGWKTVEQGAATTVWAAVAPELDGTGALYLDNCAIAQPWSNAGDPPSGYYLPRVLDPERADRLWDLSALRVIPG